jgi:hypothetical protein
VDADVDMSEGEEDAEDEADGFLNDLEAEFRAAKAEEDGSVEQDLERQKRKRAEEFSKSGLGMLQSQ